MSIRISGLSLSDIVCLKEREATPDIILRDGRFYARPRKTPFEKQVARGDRCTREAGGPFIDGLDDLVMVIEG